MLNKRRILPGLNSQGCHYRAETHKTAPLLGHLIADFKHCDVNAPLYGERQP